MIWSVKRFFDLSKMFKFVIRVWYKTTVVDVAVWIFVCQDVQRGVETLKLYLDKLVDKLVNQF